MQLRTGQSLASATDTTTVIVIRTTSDDLSLTCGGVEMVDPKSDLAARGPVDSSGPGTLLGKRYVDESETLELLCTKPGPGSLAVNGKELLLKEAKPLPASD